MLEESVGSWQLLASGAYAFIPNSPTSWFWNIRVGDKVQLNAAGIWYTVVGPLAIAPGPSSGNPELFCNVGTPGTQSPLSRTVPSPDGQSVTVYPEFVLLVNGVDDNQNGWIDEEFDGVDNNNNGLVDEPAEWVETEQWLGSVGTGGAVNLPYTVQRRPVPSANAREIALPSNIVIDLTTWGSSPPVRSRLPVNPFTGYVDVIIMPNGTALPTSIYSAPSSVGLGGAFLHFWLAERSDVSVPVQPPSGNCWLVSVFARTGRIVGTDQPAAQVNPYAYAQQGGQ